MRVPVIAGGVTLCAGIIIGTSLLTAPTRASAQTEAVSLIQKVNSEEKDLQTTSEDNDVVKEAIDSLLESTTKGDEALQTDETVDEIRHSVERGESLESIARQYELQDWKRIFYKNTDIENPDFLEVGQSIVIPKEDEELEPREVPRPDPVVEQRSSNTTSTQRATSSRSSSQAPSASVRVASTAGNRYSYGYCTWHVKNLRPDLPNNLGNANTWFVNASSQGFATGYAPRVGAVAEATSGYMHVAYVTAVHGDGTITVSEMNFEGWGVVSSRRVSAQQFRYIY